MCAAGVWQRQTGAFFVFCMCKPNVVKPSVTKNSSQGRAGQQGGRPPLLRGGGREKNDARARFTAAHGAGSLVAGLHERVQLRDVDHRPPFLVFV